MFIRSLALSLVALFSLGVGTWTSPAAAAPSSSSFFDLSLLDEDQQQIAASVIDEFDFEWSRMRRALRRETGRAQIRVRVRNLERWKALGLTWHSGLIELDDGLSDPVLFKRVFRHEIGHVVDFYLLAPNGLRRDVAALYGAPWKEIWHDFNDGFIQATSTFPLASGDSLTEEQVLQLRKLLGLDATLPQKLG